MLSSNNALWLQNFHENFLNSIKDTQQTQSWYEISMWKIQRGTISSKLKAELWFLLSAPNLTVLYICTNFHEEILNSLKDMMPLQSCYEITAKYTKGHHSITRIPQNAMPCLSELCHKMELKAKTQQKFMLPSPTKQDN